MTKDDVLALLEQADAPVSGEQMCKTLGLTRAAVWKAIEALRADGYEIEAATRRGYSLCTRPLAKYALEETAGGAIPRGKAHRPARGRLDEQLSQNACRKRRAGRDGGSVSQADGRTRTAGQELPV